MLLIVLKSDVTVAHSLLHNALELAAVTAHDPDEVIAGQGAIVVAQGVEQQALTALEALGAVLTESKLHELVRLLHLSESLGGIVHGKAPSIY